MYEIEVDEQNSKVKLTFTGALTIQNSIAIKEVLSNSLNQVKSLILNHEKVEECDLTYLQILLSLHKSAESVGKTVIINGPHPDSFIQCIKDSGLPHYSWIVGESEQENVGVIDYD